jgi:hypothetical protein
MKYSLRTLMIFVTLICVVFGGRVEYLRRMAAWHEQEARRFDLKMIESLIHKTEEAEKRDSQMMGFGIDTGGDDARASRFHEDMAMQFRKGMSRPWSFVRVPEGAEPENNGSQSSEPQTNGR